MIGVRAVQSTAGTKYKRDDIDDDGGFVADYFWEDNNQQAFVFPNLFVFPILSKIYLL